jgi:hypothetical protein
MGQKMTKGTEPSAILRLVHFVCELKVGEDDYEFITCGYFLLENSTASASSYCSAT